jgi:hypothetical protein
VHPSQAKETIVLSVLALLSRGCHQESHTYPDKPGILQGVRNMHAGMPGKSYNHGIIKKRLCLRQEEAMLL